MIRGRSITLRVFRESDLPAYLAIQNDLERKGDFVSHRLLSEPAVRKEFQETGFLTEDGGRLLIVDAEDHVLGLTGYFRPVHYMDALEIAYQVDPARRGQGIASEAAGLLVDWLFGTKKMGRLQLVLVQGNVASRRVAEKCGFHFEGVLRHGFFLKGESHDLEMWSLLREEWKERF
jgi:ribosomal-protein-alanine N-acetyltransferase